MWGPDTLTKGETDSPTRGATSPRPHRVSREQGLSTTSRALRATRLSHRRSLLVEGTFQRKRLCGFAITSFHLFKSLRRCGGQRTALNVSLHPALETTTLGFSSLWDSLGQSSIFPCSTLSCAATSGLSWVLGTQIQVLAYSVTKASPTESFPQSCCFLFGKGQKTLEAKTDE